MSHLRNALVLTSRTALHPGPEVAANAVVEEVLYKGAELPSELVRCPRFRFLHESGAHRDTAVWRAAPELVTLTLASQLCAARLQVATHTVVVEVLREGAALRGRLSGGSSGSGAAHNSPGSGYNALPSQARLHSAYHTVLYRVCPIESVSNKECSLEAHAWRAELRLFCAALPHAR